MKMKRLIFLIFAFIVVLFVASKIFGVNKSFDAPINNQQSASSSNKVQNIEEQEPTIPPVGLPTTLIIPKIGVNANVESVGLDSLGRMDVPTHADNAAWYNLGSRPGEIGNAVIDGHLDTVTGAPAVFWSLSSLTPGDRISTIDSKGQSYNFKVTSVVSYNYDNFPLEDVFGASNKASLNLITCEGVFNQATNNYSKRIVVYSELEA